MLVELAFVGPSRIPSYTLEVTNLLKWSMVMWLIDRHDLLLIVAVVDISRFNVVI
jgi:hypothetical protein